MDIHFLDLVIGGFQGGPGTESGIEKKIVQLELSWNIDTQSETEIDADKKSHQSENESPCRKAEAGFQKYIIDLF